MSLQGNQSMTHKERVRAQINHQETEIIPSVLLFEDGYQIEERVDDYYGSDQWRSLLDNSIVRYRFISDQIWTFDPNVGEYWTDLFGSRWRMLPRPRQVIEPALKAPTLDGYQFPSLEDCFDPGWKQQALKEIEKVKDKFVLADAGFGLLGRTWIMRGFETALIDIVNERDFYEEVVDQLAELLLGIIDRLVELPVDGIMFADDWGYQQGVLIGAKRWREIFKPRYAKIYDRVHTAGKYVLSHSCGSIEEILPDAIEIGLDVYESVQPETKNNNPYELKHKYGDHITFWGGLGSQSTVPFGTPTEIRSEVKKLCCEMGKGGGYILAPAKPLQPETPIENIIALLESFLEQSKTPLPVN
jgi:uroporphyrinogen decarboxylase